MTTHQKQNNKSQNSGCVTPSCNSTLLLTFHRRLFHQMRMILAERLEMVIDQFAELEARV